MKNTAASRREGIARRSAERREKDEPPAWRPRPATAVEPVTQAPGGGQPGALGAN
ncbi:MAG: hypothetical protein MZW92_44465 [Comamonadaceae bacterium]|nr:hypothetical protein [Comamonadaceae bacterium]